MVKKGGEKMSDTSELSYKRLFNAQHYDRICADFPKEQVARFKAEVKARGDTIASVLRQAIEQYLNHEAEEQTGQEN